MITMKVLQKILFTFVFVLGLSLTALAQKDDTKKPPPKEVPPVVNPQPKPPPKPTPTPRNSYIGGVWKSDITYTA